MLRSCFLAGLLYIARGRDLSAPKGPAPAPEPDFPDDPPPDPRLASLRWGAKVGGGSASLPGHLKPLGGHAPPSVDVAERTTLPSPAEMYALARTNTPVVVRGGIKFQPSYQKWTDAYMSEHFGDTVVDVEFDKAENRFGAMPESWKLRKFIAAKARDGVQDRYYVVHDLTPRMRRDWRLLPSLACRETAMQMLVMWFSSGGTSSVLHNDGQENFLTLLEGSKKLTLWHQREAHNLYVDEARKRGTSPVDVDAVDMEVFPRVAQAAYAQLTLHAGDMLFIPKSYYHQVRSFSPGKSRRNIAVNYWWKHPPDHDGEYRTGGGVLSKMVGNVPAVKLKGWPEAPTCTPYPEGTTMDQVCILTQGSGEEDQLRGGGVCAGGGGGGGGGGDDGEDGEDGEGGEGEERGGEGEERRGGEDDEQDAIDDRLIDEL